MGTSDATNDNEEKCGHFSIPANQRVKRCGMDFYENTLGSPKYVVSTCSYMFDNKPKQFAEFSNFHGNTFSHQFRRLLRWLIKANWHGDC